jgi:Ca-activated chloride channel family protein
MLEHGFRGDGDESLTWETRRSEPSRDHAQNFTGHRRSYHKINMLDSKKKGWEAVMSPRSHHRLRFLSILALLAASAAWSADKAVNEPKVSITPRAKPPADAEALPRSNIRVDTTLVLIPVTVTDPLNRFVTGLEKDNFRLFEDKEEQTLTQFSSEDAPLSVGLVFDTSGSMGNKLTKSRQAAAAFFRTANPEDQFFLVQFNDRAELVIPFTTQVEEIQNRLTFTQSKGKTALLDGVYLALDNMRQKAKNPRKALLIISDGGDNSSRYTESEVKNLVREADVQIYAIGIFEPASSRGRTAEELSGPSLLNEVAEQTGGRHFPIENLNELPDVAAKIGIELRNQYILGYSPNKQQRDGKYRKVQVKLVQPRGLPPLRAFWRMGYYAPIE